MREGEFNPEFTHQIFGDNEVITGYSKLSIKVSGPPHPFSLASFSEFLKRQGRLFWLTNSSFFWFWFWFFPFPFLSSSQIYFTAGSLRCCMQFKYDEKYQGNEIPVTDIEKKLAEWIPQGPLSFSKLLSQPFSHLPVSFGPAV